MTSRMVSFDHLLDLSDEVGTFEHADHAQPRPGHGYCADDMARVLIAITREQSTEQAVLDLGRTALRFLLDAQQPDGRVVNRRDVMGDWQGDPVVDDCWGRTMWAFGTVADLDPSTPIRRRARSAFTRGAKQTSTSPRAMAFAALGAAAVRTRAPRHDGAHRLLTDAIEVIGPDGTDPGWPWPEPRLAYANAVLPDALLAAGTALDRPDVTERGLALLGWLLDREIVDDHLSVTPVGGAGPTDTAPGFDQQPIEVATMADACARALAITGDGRWQHGIDLAGAWFTGRNDVGVRMWDQLTDGAFDGLHRTGPNLNQGAESTLAMLTTLQHASASVAVAP